MTRAVIQRVAVTTPAPQPLDLIAHLPADGFAWLHDGDGLIAHGRAAQIDPGTGADRFERAEKRLATVFSSLESRDGVGAWGTGPLAFTSFTFDPDAGGSVVVVPDVVVARRAGRSWTTGIDGAEPLVDAPEAMPADDLDRVRYAGSTAAEVAWLDAVARAGHEVRAGTLEKVVLARDLIVWSKRPFDAPRLVAVLARRFPGCFTFLCDGLVGATPELLVRRRGDEVTSIVFAGSNRRGATATEDRALGAELMSSPKERREHEIAVRSVRAVLEPLCSELTVEPQPSVVRLENVQHLATRVAGRLAEPLGALQLAGRLHPTAAVCGAPRERALSFIRDVEEMDRGRYSGPVGWVNARGDGEFGIALRCAELDGGRARLFAGAGIVEGSIPERELEETRLKLRAMQSAIGD